MASNLSEIFKNELTNTLEQLLSNEAHIEGITKFDHKDLSSTQFIQSTVKFEFKDLISTWFIYIPTASAVRLEYLMLGGMGELKERLDDEVTDAVNEIISNICGSFSTSVNAQNFADINPVKSEILGSNIVTGQVLKGKENTFHFEITLNYEKVSLYMSFDKIILPYLSTITGYKEENKNKQNETDTDQNNENGITKSEIKNLELLKKVKLKLSVRLGKKILLLKDILKWDIGEIIELEQMVNEPLDILVNGVKIGEGEAVVVEGKFGVKIKRLTNLSNSIKEIGL